MKKSLGLLFISVFYLHAFFIKEVDFKNLNYLSKESSLDIMAIKEGEDLSEEELNKAIKRLFSQGYFSSIKAFLEEDILKIVVKEKSSIAKISFTGVASNDTDNIRSILGLKQGSLFDKSSLLEAIENIKTYYEAKGYYNTVVEYELKKLEKSLELIFNVNRGENIIIEEVNLIGAKHFEYDDIRPVLKNKIKEPFGSWMWGLDDGKLRSLYLQDDSINLQDKYLEAGFLDAKVHPAFVRANMNIYKAYLSYFIEEGGRYKIADIQISSAFFNENEKKELIKSLKSKKGKIADIILLREDLASINKKLNDKGYAYAKVLPRLAKNDTTHELAIDFLIILGEKAYIRKLSVAGNTMTADRVIRRELHISEGYLYNKSSIIESVNALRRTGYFKSVNIKEIPVSNTEIDLIVEIDETRTGSITGGIGYGTSDGIVITAAVSEKNIFGSGIQGSINIEREEDGMSGTISMYNPRLDDSDYSLSGQFYSNRYDWNTYDEKNYGFSTSIGRLLGKYTKISLGYNLEFSDILKLAPNLQNIGYRLGKSSKSSIYPSISFNNTDDFYLPRKGIIASAGFEYAGLGGDQKFSSIDTSLKYFKGLKELVGSDIILRARADFSKKFDQGYLPVNQKIYLGGMGSIRGFDSRSLSPKNIYGDELGGNIAMTSSLTFSFPLLERIGLRANTFIDYAMIGEKSLSEIVRYSTGLALEWNSPIGAIQFIYAFPFNTGPQDTLRQFEFSLGSFF